ncbi:hypothetical protein ACOSQ2_029340 [Xanthoceras sorbifolium]
MPHTPVFGPSRVHSSAPDLRHSTCDPRSTIKFLLSSNHGLHCTAITVLLCASRPSQRLEFCFHQTTVEVLCSLTVFAVIMCLLQLVADDRRVTLHHCHGSLCRPILLYDLLLSLSVLVDCVSHIHSRLRPRLVVCGLYSITEAISPDCFGLVW